MKFKINCSISMKSGDVKNISWEEVDPKIAQKDKDTGKVVREMDATEKEVTLEFRKFFIQSMKDGEPLSFSDDNGNVHVIDSKEVEGIEFDVGEIDEV